MKYGLCVNMDARDEWGVGYERIAIVAELGYDYVELPLAQMTAMPEAAFEREVLGALGASGIPCRACNNFFPADVRLTGSAADLARISAYVEAAVSRAARAGARVIVMGSSGARNLPRGTTQAEGYRQLADALRVIAPIAGASGIHIALEPLNRLESNILNSYQSGLYLAALSGQENVGTLVDAFHFGLGNEQPSDLSICAPSHVHFATLLGRKLPECADSAGRAFFGALKDAGYDGRVSLEGFFGQDFEASAKLALAVLRELGG